MTAPAYVLYCVVGTSVGIVAFLLSGLNAGLAGWPARERKSAVRTVAAVMVAWFGVAVALAASEVYQAASDRVPTIQFGILIPVLIGGVMIWRSPWMSRLIDAVPQTWVIGIQVYRVVGAIFLTLYASRLLPGLFAVPAGTGDVAVGLLAPVVAAAAFGTAGPRAWMVWGWNLLGIADFVAAIATGFLTSPSPVQQFAFDYPNQLITAFPLVLIPTFVVPLSIILHMISLTRLVRSPVA